MVTKCGVVLASANQQAKPAATSGPRLLLKLLRLSKKDSKADNSGKVIEDKREGENDINPIKRRKVDSREVVIRVKRALVVKKPYKRKTGSRQRGIVGIAGRGLVNQDTRIGVGAEDLSQ